jgi:Ca-activated chloride channel homolog
MFNFLAPAAFALTLLIPLVVAMYLLKLRRTEQVVSSVYLWRRMVRDVEANAPWQRLQRNLLLILQLLILGALILALARPFTLTEGATGQTTILILDTSASMSAVDVAPSRLEAAKGRARQLVSSIPDDARLTVIATGDKASVLIASSQDRRQVLQAIDNIQASAGSSDLTSALQLASAIASRQVDSEIIILSDGRANLPERLALKGRVRYLPFGLSADNQAISLLTLESAPGSGNLTAFAQVTNYGETLAHRRLNLYVDQQLVNAFDLEIPPGEQVAVLTDDLPAGTRRVEARLTQADCPEPCVADALPLDDRAWAVYRSGTPTSVRLVSEGNLFLEIAFSLLPGIELTTIKPDDYTADLFNQEAGAASEPEPAFDLTIFDNFLPPATSGVTGGETSSGVGQETDTPVFPELPEGNLLFIAPPRSTAYFTVTGELQQPALLPVVTDDPLLAYLTLANVNVLKAMRIPLPIWARPVIAGDALGDTSPLLFAGEVDDRRVAVLAFDLHNSDLPLQVAFPLLLANLTGWLAPGGGAELPAYLPPGAPVSLSLPIHIEETVVTRPDGSRLRLTTQDGRLIFTDTSQLGIYKLSWTDSEPLEFAVNLFSPLESDIRPVDNLPLSGVESDDAAQGTHQARREWWRPLAFIALGILTAEWLVYYRATLSRLVTQAIRRLSGGEVQTR